MKAELKMGSVIQIMKGTTVFEQGEQINGIGLIVKGRIKICGEGAVFTVGTGTFLGICDLVFGKHRVTYVAETDCVVYLFSTEGKPLDVSSIIREKKEYGTLMITSMIKEVVALSDIVQSLSWETTEIYTFLKTRYVNFQTLEKYGSNPGKPLSLLEKLQPFSAKTKLEKEKISYYIDCRKISSEVQKAYYGASLTIGTYHVMELIDLINRMQDSCREYMLYLKEAANALVKDDRSLYMETVQLANAMKNTGWDDEEVQHLLDDIIDQINILEKVLMDKCDIDLEIDREFMEEVYCEVMMGSNKNVEEVPFALVEEIEDVPDLLELKNSLSVILKYGKLEQEKAECLKNDIIQFEHLADKFSNDEDVRKLCKEICKIYYELYAKVFRQAYKDGADIPVAVDLFLRYGFLSERLLSESIQEELLAMKPGRIEQEYCHVYDMKEWLTAVYEGRKEPSKSEFDMDYEQYLRDMKKNGQITTQQAAKMANDQERKLDYEIQNLFRSNHRLLQGSVSIFVPFLFTEGCSGMLHNAYLEKERINAAIHRILTIDYSAFYREGVYYDENSGMQKEYIMEEVFPDVIVFPIYGSRGVMWQELSGRKRNSKGRFLLPQFLDGELDAVMVKMFARFRWELCRTIQGADWNNIQDKSLTSEYSDFIQFYRKNRDLSEEKKEKVRMQIQKNRNNTREVFVQDYENWIRHEAKGGLCLNKPVREIMATYCPFAKPIREKIADQPLFQEAMSRYLRQKGKKVREYELKTKIWVKDGIEVPEIVKKTRDFYVLK